MSEYCSKPVPKLKPVLEVLNPPVLKKSELELSITVFSDLSEFLKLGLTTENFPFNSSSEREKFEDNLIPLPR